MQIITHGQMMNTRDRVFVFYPQSQNNNFGGDISASFSFLAEITPPLFLNPLHFPAEVLTPAAVFGLQQLQLQHPSSF
ncbi:MAG: hypothetical protein IKD69_10600 [Solobacterium sp.]|nr:hypothetical protein [Solobacterium sp.]